MEIEANMILQDCRLWNPVRIHPTFLKPPVRQNPEIVLDEQFCWNHMPNLHHQKYLSLSHRGKKKGKTVLIFSSTWVIWFNFCCHVNADQPTVCNALFHVLNVQTMPKWLLLTSHSIASIIFCGRISVLRIALSFLTFCHVAGQKENDIPI